MHQSKQTSHNNINGLFFIFDESFNEFTDPVNWVSIIIQLIWFENFRFGSGIISNGEKSTTRKKTYILIFKVCCATKIELPEFCIQALSRYPRRSLIEVINILFNNEKVFKKYKSNVMSIRKVNYFF